MFTAFLIGNTLTDILVNSLFSFYSRKARLVFGKWRWRNVADGPRQV